MATSREDELRKIAESDDLHVAPFRDGRSDLRNADMDLVRDLDRVSDAHRAIEGRGTQGKLYLRP